MKQPQIALMPCPHCGSPNAPMFWTTSESMDGCDCDAAGNEEGFAVVCDASTDGRGGCGASGGFRATTQQAADAWNRRPNAGVNRPRAEGETE